MRLEKIRRTDENGHERTYFRIKGRLLFDCTIYVCTAEENDGRAAV